MSKTAKRPSGEKGDQAKEKDLRRDTMQGREGLASILHGNVEGIGKEGVAPLSRENSFFFHRGKYRVER